MKINPNGFRTDLKDYFECNIKHQSHTAMVRTPFMVVTSKEIKAMYYIRDLLKEHSRTRVLHAWVGQWRTDVFLFTVKELREYIDNLRDT